MNWIDFMKEKPKAEPKRRVLVLDKHGDAYSMWSDCPFMSESNRTHWAEIEPPPEPDPFEKWWVEWWVKGDDITPLPRDTAKAAWDAAIKYAKEQNQPGNDALR